MQNIGPGGSFIIMYCDTTGLACVPSSPSYLSLPLKITFTPSTSASNSATYNVHAFSVL